MTGASQDWIFIAAFFGAFAAVTAGEVFWLIRKLDVPAKKALIAVLLPNFLTITLGFFVSFIIFGILLAMTASDNTELLIGGAPMWPAFIAALAFPLILMVLARRILIGGLRVEQIESPLTYSIISTLIFSAFVFGVSAIILGLR